MVQIKRSEDNIFDTIKRIVLTVDQSVYFTFSALGVTFSKYKIMEYLYVNPDKKISQVDIQDYYSLRNPTVTRLLQALEKKGLVERITDAQDKRKKIIILTAKSLSAIDKMLVIRLQLDELLAKDLSDAEQKQLLFLLKKVLRVAIHSNPNARRERRNQVEPDDR